MIITGCKNQKWNETKKRIRIIFLVFVTYSSSTCTQRRISSISNPLLMANDQFPIQLEFIFGMYTFTFCCYQIS